MVVISHNDSDGIACVSLLYKVKNNFKIPTFFTTPSNLKNTLCMAMINRKLKELYIFDLSGNKQTCRIASAFLKVTWIDHHIWKEKEEFENVEYIIKSYPSACELVAEHFGLKEEVKELIEIINEIDTNRIKREDALFLRDLVGAIKKKFSANYSLLNNKFREIARILTFEGLEKLKSEEFCKLVLDYRGWIEKEKEDILKKAKVSKINGLKVVFYETLRFIPTYIIFNELEKHEEAPFDVIAVFYYKHNAGKVFTKLEFRTQTGKDVFKIAESLGGGGHKVASGATLNYLFTPAQLEKLIEKM